MFYFHFQMSLFYSIKALKIFSTALTLKVLMDKI